MLNRIILMGRLTRDPELRHTQTGTPWPPSAWRWTGISRTAAPARRPPTSSMSWPGGRRLSSSPASSPRAVWPWWRAVSSSATGPTGTATSAVLLRSSRTMCSSATPSGMPRRRLAVPPAPASGGGYGAPAPAPAAPAYSAPLGGGDQFADLSDDDGSSPSGSGTPLHFGGLPAWRMRRHSAQCGRSRRARKHR